RRDIVFCQQTAQNLLANQIDIRPLHGDLHHDNIRLGARGYCAFDAKGVLGERAYELANAFRNPKGAEKIVTAPERVVSLAQSWSQAFDVDQQRLLQWAMVKVALSISWRCNGKLKHDGEFALLALFRAVMKRG
ncbi:MAG: hypothetical protein JKX69_13820, partial [Rhodobacteraceae bacterium]|nr:hypothetical protein [Paracoccaceae bacterium]